jgi:hypothetical protein
LPPSYVSSTYCHSLYVHLSITRGDGGSKLTLLPCFLLPDRSDHVLVCKLLRCEYWPFFVLSWK